MKETKRVWERERDIERQNRKSHKNKMKQHPNKYRKVSSCDSVYDFCGAYDARDSLPFLYHLRENKIDKNERMTKKQ